MQTLGALSARLVWLALHVTTQGSYPKPLSRTEEQACLLAMHDGDADARNKLIEHNLRLVAHIVKKYYTPAQDQEDLLSIGTYGLIKGVTTFSADRNTRLATYAARCIENEILMHFRAQKKNAQNLFISDPIDTDKDGNALTLIDVIADDTCIAEVIDLKIRSEKLLELIRTHLEPRAREIIVLRYGLTGGDDLTQREVAARLGISRSYVYYIAYYK